MLCKRDYIIQIRKEKRNALSDQFEALLSDYCVKCLAQMRKFFFRNFISKHP